MKIPRKPVGSSHNAEEGNQSAGGVDAGIQGALDTFCSKEEETYESFMQSFSQLSQADVERQQVRHAMQQALSQQHKQTVDGDEDAEESPVAGFSASHQMAAQKQDTVPIATEEIEEHMLPSSCSSLAIEHKGRAKLKVDNFLPDENDSDGEAENEVSGYQASFGTSDPSKADDEVSESQTETEERNNSFLDKEKENAEVSSKNASFIEKQPTASEARDVDTIVTKAITRQISHEKSKTNRETDTQVVYDSTGEPHCDFVSDELGIDLADDEIEDGDRDMSEMPNPGEVGPGLDELGQSQSQVETRSTQLDFSEKQPTTVIATEECCEQEQTAESTSTNIKETDQQEPVSDSPTYDEVVPFEIDKDFDYDNVVLTPKFTAAEMAYLDRFRPKPSSEP